jgi:hypothetical protein
MTLPDIVASRGRAGFARAAGGDGRLDPAHRADSFERLFEFCAGCGDRVKCVRQGRGVAVQPAGGSETGGGYARRRRPGVLSRRSHWRAQPSRSGGAA